MSGCCCKKNAVAQHNVTLGQINEAFIWEVRFEKVLDDIQENSIKNFDWGVDEQSLENLSLPHRYATITIAVGSFQLITDRAVALQALKNMHAHMLHGGNLLLDIFVPDTGIDKRSVRIARIDDHTVIRLTTRHMFDEQLQLADAFCLYELVVDCVVQQQEEEFMQIVWRSDDEWQELLREAGFEIIKIYNETFRSSGPSRVIHAQVYNKILTFNNENS